MAHEGELARRYAKALFEAALGERGLEEEAERVGRELAQAAKAAAAKGAAFSSPALGAARQKAMLREVAGRGASAKTLRLLEILAERKRLGLLPRVALEFAKLSDERRGLVRAGVASAAALAPKDLARLKKALERFSGKKVEISARTAPELLAGLTVRLGDWVLDGSLQGRVRRLGEQLARMN